MNKQSTPAVEALSQQAVDMLREKAPTAKRLKALLDQIRPVDQEAFTGYFKERLDALEVDVRQLVDANLQALEKNTVFQGSRQMLDMLRASVESMRSSAVSAASNTVEAGSDLVERGKLLAADTFEQAKHYADPRNWSKTGQAIGLAAAGTVALYGAYRLGRWFFSGAKKKVGQAKEATKTSFGWLKTAAIVGGVGVLAFFGIRQAQKFMDKLNQFGEFADKSIEELKKTKAELQRQISDAIAEGKQVPAKVQKKMDQLERAYQAKLEEERVQRDTSDPVVKNEDEPMITEDQKETAERLVVTGALPAIAKGLVMFEEVPDWDKTEDVKVQHMTDVLSSNKATLMGDILVNGSPDKLVKDEGIDRPSKLKAAALLIRFCTEHQAAMVSRGLTKEEIMRMPLEEYIKQTGGVYNAVGSIITSINENNGDIAAALRDTDLGEMMQTSGALQSGISAFVEENEELSDLNDLSMADLLTVLPTMVMSPNEFMANYPASPTPVEQVIYRICEEMDTMETAKYMAPFFHSEFTSDEEMEAAASDVERARIVLKSRLSVSEAVRMHLYARMMKSGNPTGVVLMQSEVFKYAADPDNDDTFLGIRRHTLVNRIAKAGFRGTWDELTEADLDIDTNLVGKALEKMGVVAQNSASALASGLLRTVGETLKFGGVTIWENPGTVGVPVALLSTGYLYTKYRGHRIYTDPEKVILRLGDMKSGRNADARVVRFMRQLEIGNQDIASTKRALERIRDGVNAIEDAGDTRKHIRLWDAYHDCMSATFESSGSSWRRFAQVCADEGISAAWVDDVKTIRDTRKLRATVSIAAQPWWGRIREYSRLATSPLRRVGKNLNYVRSIREAGAWRTAGWVGGIGLHGLALYGDYMELEHLQEQHNATREAAKDSLNSVALRFENDDSFEKKEDGVYVHKASGVEIELKTATKELGSVDDAFGTREGAQTARTLNTAASLGTMALMGPKLAAGPAGLVVVGVELVIRAGINMREESSLRAFLTDCPPWLLAYLGTQSLTGGSEYDWLVKGSSWMSSDYWPDGVENDVDKREIRKRMLFTLFYADLGRFAPEVLQEITAGMDSPAILNQFYAEDFQTHILPWFSAILFRKSQSDNLNWNSVAEGKIGGGWVVLPPNVSRIEISESMREAAVLYVQHLRENRYVTYANELARQEAEDPLTALPALYSLVAQMGETKVLGTELADFDPAEFEANGGKTRAELVMAALIKQIEEANGSTRAEKTAAGNIFAVNAGVARGLLDTVDLSSEDSVLSLLDDPALHMKLKDVVPDTLEEEVAVEGRRWNDWSQYIDEFGTIPDGSEIFDTIRYSAPFALGDSIARTLNQPDISPEPTVFGALTGTRSGDGLSHGGARAYVTENGTQVVEQAYANREELRTFKRNSSLEKELYGVARGPVVYTSGIYSEDQSRAVSLLKYPEGAHNVKGFESKNLKAVYFEGARLGKTGHEMVLATYVYGDPESGKVSILQQVGGTFLLARMQNKSIAEGTVTAFNAQQFLQKPGAEHMLELARTGAATKTEEVEAYEEQQHQEELQYARERAEEERIWREETAPEALVTALDKAKASPDTFVHITGDWFLKVQGEQITMYKPPHYFSGPAFTAGTGGPKESSGTTTYPVTEGDKHRFLWTTDRDSALKFYVSGGEEKGAGRSVWYYGDSWLQREENAELRTLVDEVTDDPVLGNDFDVERIVDMFPSDVFNPRLWGSRKNYRFELVNPLKVLYNKIDSTDKQELFLQELRAQIRNAHDGHITAEAASKIPQWFKSHKSMFGIE